MEHGRALPYPARAAAGRGHELDREDVMRPSIALCLFAGVLLAGCGDDDGSSSVDAAPTIDGSPADANPNAPDANPNAPDANVDATPAGPVREEQCVGVISLTVTAEGGSDGRFVFPDGDKDKVPLGGIVKFEMPAIHDATSGPNATADNKFRVDFGAEKCLKFLEAGTYDFFCSRHPSMRAALTVVAP
jgi:plastocyanin